MNTEVLQLWEEMRQVYGNKWASAYGTNPPRRWIEEVALLKRYQLRHAVNTLSREGGEFVPTMPTFIKTAKSAPRETDPNAARLEHKAEVLTPEQQRENQRLFAEVAKLATQGKFKGWSEADINEYIKTMRCEG